MPSARVCVVTGGRAEYGLLVPLMRKIAAEPALELQVVVTGTHLARAFGLTITTIREDGFPVDAEVPCLPDADTGAAMAAAVGGAIPGFAAAFDRLRPDVVVLLGDRFEMFAAAQAAFFVRVPIAHIAGGDVTEGALDDTMRHMITKTASLHFVSHAGAARRVRQLGEDPATIFDVGHLGLDGIRELVPMTRDELATSIGYTFCARNLLVTFHPATLDPTPPERQFAELVAALHDLGDDVGVVFTQPNADPGGRALDAAVRNAVPTFGGRAVLVETLGQRRYLSLLREVDAVVGNSSSGVLEAPFLRVPTVNIGDRQTGRPRAVSVFDCAPERGAIVTAIERAVTWTRMLVESPFGDGHTAERIVQVLVKEVPALGTTRKRFVDLGDGDG